jgi:hypothetical protein
MLFELKLAEGRPHVRRGLDRAAGGTFWRQQQEEERAGPLQDAAMEEA